MEVKRIAKNKKNAIALGIVIAEFGSKASCFHSWEDHLEDHLSIRENCKPVTYDPNKPLISKKQYDLAMKEWEKDSPRNAKAFKNWESKQNSK